VSPRSGVFHNYRHHVFTNIIGNGRRLGYGVLRVTRDQQWRLSNLLQPLRNMLLAIMFEWGIALQGLHSAHHRQRQTPRKPPRQGPDPQVCPANRQGLSVLSRAEPSPMAPHAHGERVRQPAAQCVGVSCDLLGTFRWRGEVHPATLEGETKPEWVSATMLVPRTFAPGRCWRSKRQPVLPDRTPLFSLIFRVTATRSRRTGSGGVHHL